MYEVVGVLECRRCESGESTRGGLPLLLGGGWGGAGGLPLENFDIRASSEVEI